MNKSSLVTLTAKKMGVSKKEAMAVIETVVGAIMEGAIAEGNCVIPGLGKLVRVKTAARKGITNGKEWVKEEGEKLKLRLNKAGKSVL